MRIALLPGDGIGPEVTAAARQVLAELAPDVEVSEHLFGGAAIIAAGTPLPDETLAACRDADAILLGAVGLPQFDGADVRPEQGLLGLRRELDVYANLRPSVGNGVDLMVVRELIGGLYFGPRGTREDGTVFDTLEYHPREVERIAHRGFEIARTRQEPCHLGRQGERARHVADVATGRHRGRRRLPGRRARARAGRRGRDAPRPATRSAST